jgi:hypothetical protein
LLQEFLAAVEQLVHRVLLRLPEDPNHRTAACASFDGEENWEVKQYLLMDDKRSLNEALNHNLKCHVL